MRPPQKRHINKWVKALRSGKYKQYRERLQSKYGYCCLGVACDIFIPETKLKLEYGNLAGVVPRDQPHAPQWLKGVNTHFMQKAGSVLSTLNDGVFLNEGRCTLTFDEIADLLEAVYIHEVLE